MVRTSQWERYLEEQKIKEKRRLEKEATEKRRKEVIEKYSLERKLAEELEDILFRLEQPIEYSILHPELGIMRRKETKKKAEKVEKIEKIEKVKKVEKVIRTHIPRITRKKRPEFILSEEDKAKCIEKTLDQLVDEISGSKLVCPPGKELKKDIDQRELTADIICFRKRVIKKSPEEIVALYDKLLADDPERLCKKKE